MDAKKSLFDKGKPEGLSKLKSFSKEEIRAMKRSQLRELAKSVVATTAGADADVADRLILIFERSADSDVMIVESFFYLLVKGFRSAPIAGIHIIASNKLYLIFL